MEKKKAKSSFLVQGSILAAASIVVRIIGMLYRIPLTGIIGDVGNGIYSGAFEVYSILLLISSYSLPLAVSKLVSRHLARGEKKNAFRYFTCALSFAFVVGLSVSLFTYLAADFLAGTVMSSPLSALSLQVLAPTIFVVAVMGVLRGYFQGMGNMLPTALSQLVEQIVNAFVSVGAAYVLVSYGKRVSDLIKVEGYDAAYGAMGSTMGTFAGALAGMLVMGILMALYLWNYMPSIRADRTKKLDSMSVVYRNIFVTIVPVILSTAVYNVSSVLDQGVFNKIMSLQGYAHEEYNALWGIFSGKYRLLTNVPVSIASALAASTVIAIQTAVSKKNRKEVIAKTRMGIRFVMLVTIPCAVGLTVLASPILQLLWHDGREISANLLRVGSISVVLYSLSTLTNAILQGVDKMRVPVINALISLVLHMTMLVVMLVVFRLNVYAVVYANVFFAFLMCVLNGRAIRKYVKGYRQEVVRTFLIPGFCSLIMGGVAFGVHRGLTYLTHSNAIGTLAAMVLAVVVYFVTMLLFGGITERDLHSMPKGRLLLRVARKLHLLPPASRRPAR